MRRDTVGCDGMPWDAVGCDGIPWGATGCCGDATGCRGMPWGATGYRGVRRDAVGMRRDATGCSGMPWGCDVGCDGMLGGCDGMQWDAEGVRRDTVGCNGMLWGCDGMPWGCDGIWFLGETLRCETLLWKHLASQRAADSRQELGVGSTLNARRERKKRRCLLVYAWSSSIRHAGGLDSADDSFSIGGCVFTSPMNCSMSRLSDSAV